MRRLILPFLISLHIIPMQVQSKTNELIPKIFLSQKEILNLSPQKRKNYLLEVRTAFIEAEKLQSSNGVLLAVNQVNFDIANVSVLFLSPALAAIGDSCIYAGYISSIVKKADGRLVCNRPQHPHCQNGKIPCNPEIFGYSDYKEPTPSKPYCISPMQSASKACAAKDPDMDSTIWAPYNMNSLSLWDKSAIKIEKMCLGQTNRSRDTEACQVLLERISQARASYANHESETCKSFPRIARKTWGSYAISQTGPNKYKAEVNVKFKGANAETLKLHAQNCLNQYKQSLRGPNGETLEIQIGTQNSSRIKQKVINSQPAGFRSNASNWEANIDCPTVLHEMLHVLGLVDDYHEQWTGFKLEVPSEAEYNQSPPPPKISRVTDSPDYADYDCRVLGPTNSVMSNQWNTVSEQREGKISSLLRPAQFNAIVYPDCNNLNKTYNLCSQFAMRTSKWETRSMNQDIAGDCANSSTEHIPTFRTCKSLEARGRWLDGVSWDSALSEAVPSSSRAQSEGDYQ